MEEKSSYDVQVAVQSKNEHGLSGTGSTGEEVSLEGMWYHCLPVENYRTQGIRRQRRFGYFSMLGFTCTILVTWEGSLV